MSNLVSLPDDPLHSYDGAKKPSLQPEEQNSDTESINSEDNWMPSPLVTNCPPGLQYLTEIDKFVVSLNREIRESKIKFLIKNNLAQKVYTAVDEYDKCCTICCNIKAPFDVRVFDFQEREVLHFHRPFRCQSCWFPCCLQSVEVTASGTLCGSIKQSWSPFSTKFRVCDATGKTVLLIKGPFFTSMVFGPDFKILSSDGKTELGCVSIFFPDFNTFRDQILKGKGFYNFDISFPMDLDVNIKAVLLAASILIDCLYYDSAHRIHRRSHNTEVAEVGCEICCCLGHLFCK